jgi:hypothetical protein
MKSLLLAGAGATLIAMGCTSGGPSREEHARAEQKHVSTGSTTVREALFLSPEGGLSSGEVSRSNVSTGPSSAEHARAEQRHVSTGSTTVREALFLSPEGGLSSGKPVRSEASKGPTSEEHALVEQRHVSTGSTTVRDALFLSPRQRTASGAVERPVSTNRTTATSSERPAASLNADRAPSEARTQIASFTFVGKKPDASSVASVEGALRAVSGFRSIDIAAGREEFSVIFDATLVGKDAILTALKTTGEPIQPRN